MNADNRYEGTVKFYSQEEEFGFIGSKSPKLSNDAWFHITDVRDKNPPKVGDKVTFSISEKMKRGRRYTALKILIKHKLQRQKNTTFKGEFPCIRGEKPPSSGDSVKFSSNKGKKGKPAATDIETVSQRSAHSRRPYYGKNIQRPEVVEHGRSKLASATGFGLLGYLLGPIGGIVGALFGAAIGEDTDDVTKQVDITSPCIRCGGKGHVTSRVDERTGFQCPTCGNFWKVPDSKLPQEDLAALEEIDFTK